MTERMSEEKHFAICIATGEYGGTLQLCKLYEVLADAEAAKRWHVRIIDESGEDYLYPQAWFVPVDVPANVEQLLHDLAVK